jgi:hypothetical protein
LHPVGAHPYDRDVFNDPEHCPAEPDEVAEAYCMGTLDRVAAIAFEDHYIRCHRCAELVEATEKYVRAMQLAASRLRPTRAASGGY